MTSKSEKTKSEAPAFDWSSLPTTVEATLTTATGTRFDIETIPAFIRDAVETSYRAYKTREVNGRDGSKRVESDPNWRWVWVPTVEMGDEFADFARKYGKYRTGGAITVRVNSPLDAANVPDVPQKDGFAVRFCGKPLETKKPRAK